MLFLHSTYTNTSEFHYHFGRYVIRKQCLFCVCRSSFRDQLKAKKDTVMGKNITLSDITTKLLVKKKGLLLQHCHNTVTPTE